MQETPGGMIIWSTGTTLSLYIYIHVQVSVINLQLLGTANFVRTAPETTCGDILKNELGMVNIEREDKKRLFGVVIQNKSNVCGITGRVPAWVCVYCWVFSY